MFYKIDVESFLFFRYARDELIVFFDDKLEGSLDVYEFDFVDKFNCSYWCFFRNLRYKVRFLYFSGCKIIFLFWEKWIVLNGENVYVRVGGF